MPNVITPEGDTVSVPDDAVESALAAGYKLESVDAANARSTLAGKLAPYQGTGAAIKAGLQGAFRGATLGLSDVVQRIGGTDAEDLSLLKKANPTVSTVGELGGGLATAILSGGAGAAGAAARLTPSGLVSKAAMGLGERMSAAGGAGAARRVGALTTSGALEGAAQNVGSYISDVALENKALSAEGFVASAGQGALWGGAAGGALAGVERGTIAARRMFPRSTLQGKEAHQIAESTFRAQAADTVKAGDELQKAAESAVKDLRLRSAELNLERERLRGATDAASRVRLKEIAVEKAQIATARKAERDALNAERAAKGMPDLPPEPMPQVPILDDVAPPTGPPGVAPSLAGSDDLASRLAATKGLLDEGVPFADIGAVARQADDLSIAAGNTAHEAGMLADDAARGGQDAAEKVAALSEDFADRLGAYKALVDPDREAAKVAVKDWIAGIRAKAGPTKYEYRNSFTGEKLGGGASVKTDRVRTSFDDAAEEQGSVYDRVWAGIGKDADEVVAPVASGADESLRAWRKEADFLSGRGHWAQEGGLPQEEWLARHDVNFRRSQTMSESELARLDVIDAADAKPRPPVTVRVKGEEMKLSRDDIADIAFEPMGKEGSGFVRARIKMNDGTEHLTAPAKGADADALRARLSGEEPAAALPRGFGLDVEADGVKLFNESATISRGVPDYATLKAGDYRDTAYIVSPSELTSKKLHGIVMANEASDAKRIASIKAAYAEGKKLPALEIDISPSGKLFVADGNHRLLAAAEDGEQVVARFRPVSEDALEGVQDIRDRVAKAGGGRRPGDVLDAEYDALVAKAADADGPSSLKELAKAAGDIEDEIFARVEARGGKDADQVARIRANRAKYGWSSADVAARRAEKLAIAEPGMPPLSAKAQAEARDVTALERTMRENQFGSGKTAGEVAREMTAPRSLADEILEGARGPAPVAAEAFGMGRFVDDANEAIRIVGDMERAAHALVTELGPAAPPAMQKLASDYAAAVDDQARRMTESMAAKADDTVRGMDLMTLPKPPTLPSSQIGKRATEAAGALEWLQMAGDIPGLPSASDLPVIGPVLSLYLKYKAGRSMMSRLGGRIPASAEAKVAARSAEIRDKAAGIVDALLEGVGKGAKAVRKPVVVAGPKLIDAVKYSLYPDGSERKEDKTAAEATKARVRELAAATSNPDAVRATVRRQVGTTNPDMSAAIEDAVLRKLTYLQKHAPKQPLPGPLGSRPWSLSAAEVERFARRIRAAESPITVLEDFERGVLTPEAAETLRVVYPAMFAEVQTRLLTRAAELEANLPYQRVLQASLLFDVPLDASLRPENMRRLQSAHASSQVATGSPAQGQNAGQPPAPSVAGPVNVARLYETSEMRRATRR